MTLTAEQHARVRLQLALIPAYLWLFTGWGLVMHPPGLAKAWDVKVRDFIHFYAQGAAALEHDPTSLYTIDGLTDVERRVVPEINADDARYPPVYGPQISVLFAPLARLSYRTALAVWLVVTFVGYALCGYLIWRVCPTLRAEPWTVAAVLAASPALQFLAAFAHISVIALACFTAGYLALRANKPFAAGLAIGALAYKPQLGIAAALVFLAAREWRIVLGALIGVAAELGVGIAYWGLSILPAYAGALGKVPEVTSAMEGFAFRMHSWRAFFTLLGFAEPLATIAYLVAAAVTLGIALVTWRSSGALALRYSALLIATVLVDPHFYVYDFVVLTPALMLLWDWARAQPEQNTDLTLQSLVYFCYASPLLGVLASRSDFQASVPALFVLSVLVLRRAVRHESAHRCTALPA